MDLWPPEDKKWTYGHLKPSGFQTIWLIQLKFHMRTQQYVLTYSKNQDLIFRLKLCLRPIMNPLQTSHFIFHIMIILTCIVMSVALILKSLSSFKNARRHQFYVLLATLSPAAVKLWPIQLISESKLKCSFYMCQNLRF